MRVINCTCHFSDQVVTLRPAERWKAECKSQNRQLLISTWDFWRRLPMCVRPWLSKARRILELFSSPYPARMVRFSFEGGLVLNLLPGIQDVIHQILHENFLHKITVLCQRSMGLPGRTAARFGPIIIVSRHIWVSFRYWKQISKSRLLTYMHPLAF